MFEDEGIFKKNTTDFFSTNENEDKQMLIAFPIVKNTQWETNDKTSLQMKLGYDRIYDTNLPFKLTNKIESINETVSIDGKKIKNCIKISGYGKTSYNPGPPLDVINIEVFSTSWFAKGYCLVKYIREEKSDSETMGKIFYEKNKNFIGQLEFPGIDSIEVTPALIQAVAEKYLYAIYEAKKIYDYMSRLK